MNTNRKTKIINIIFFIYKSPCLNYLLSIEMITVNYLPIIILVAMLRCNEIHFVLDKALVGEYYIFQVKICANFPNIAISVKQIFVSDYGIYGRKKLY